MAKSWRGAVVLLHALVVLLALGGCAEDTTGGPPPGHPRGGPGAGGPAAKSNPAIKEIMGKVAKGPQSLTGLIGKELAADPPPWDTIQPQAKELATLAASMRDLEPAIGSKESWAEQTSAYTAEATTLAKAAEDKDLEAARDAHGTLSRSCMACHRAHRAGGPGMGKGGFGPRGGRGGRPPGPPGAPADAAPE